MKNNLVKYYIAAMYLCTTFIMFAQPGTGDTGGTLEGDGDVTPGAPIDDFIPVLAIIGIIVVFMRFRALKAKEIKRQNRTY